MFFVEGYDKDNSERIRYNTSKFTEKAKEIAIVLDKIAMRGELIRYTSDFTKEPIDWVHVIDERNFRVFANRN